MELRVSIDSGQVKCQRGWEFMIAAEKQLIAEHIRQGLLSPSQIRSIERDLQEQGLNWDALQLSTETPDEINQGRRLHSLHQADARANQLKSPGGSHSWDAQAIHDDVRSAGAELTAVDITQGQIDQGKQRYFYGLAERLRDRLVRGDVLIESDDLKELDRFLRQCTCTRENIGAGYAALRSAQICAAKKHAALIWAEQVASLRFPPFYECLKLFNLSVEDIGYKAWQISDGVRRCQQRLEEARTSISSFR